MIVSVESSQSRAAYMTLSDYQEAKIRRFHEIYDQVLGLTSAE